MNFLNKCNLYRFAVGAAFLSVSAFSSGLCASGSSVLSELQLVGQTAISQDGKLLAYAIASPVVKGDGLGYLSHIFVVATDGSIHRQFTRGDVSCTQPAFSPDGQYLSFLSARDSSANKQIWLLPLSGGESWHVTDSPTDIDYHRWSSDGQQIAYVTGHPENNSNSPGYVLRIVSIVDNGLPETGTSGSPVAGIHSFDWSATEPVLFYISYDETGNSIISELNLNNSRHSRIMSAESPISHLRCSPNGKFIAYILRDSDTGADKLEVITRADGTKKLLSMAQRYLFEITGWTHDNKAVLYTGLSGTGIRLFRRQLRDELTTALLAEKGIFRDIAISADSKKLAFIRESTGEPPNVYITGVKKSIHGKLTNLNNDIPTSGKAKTERVTWQTPDNREYAALLTYPVSYEFDRRYPLVVMISRNDNTPFTENYLLTQAGYPVNMFSQKGYAVLQANALTADFTTPEQQDYLNMANQVVAMGLAHPDSLCLFGWDSGGIRAIQLAVNTNRFKTLSVGSGYDKAFPAILHSGPACQNNGQTINWQDVGQLILNTDSFTIKGFNTPIQMILMQDAKSDTIAASNFLKMLAGKNCLTDMALVPNRLRHTEITYTEQIHQQIVEWFEQSLRGKDPSPQASFK